MKLTVDIDLPGLDEKLGELLPGGTEPTAVRLDASELRIEGRGPFGVRVALTARVAVARGRLTASDFAFEGPGLVRGVVLDAVRRKVAACDVRNQGFRVFGEEDGARLVVAWS